MAVLPGVGFLVPALIVVYEHNAREGGICLWGIAGTMVEGLAGEVADPGIAEDRGRDVLWRRFLSGTGSLFTRLQERLRGQDLFGEGASPRDLDLFGKGARPRGADRMGIGTMEGVETRGRFYET